MVVFGGCPTSVCPSLQAPRPGRGVRDVGRGGGELGQHHMLAGSTSSSYEYSPGCNQASSGCRYQYLGFTCLNMEALIRINLSLPSLATTEPAIGMPIRPECIECSASVDLGSGPRCRGPTRPVADP